MTERLRSRDSRSNVNKCYTIYFEDDTFGIGKQRKRDTTSLPRERNLKTKSTSKNQVKSKERLVNNHHTSKRVVGSKIKKPMISSKPKKKNSSQYELRRTTSSEAPQELAPTQPEQKLETEFQEERDENKNTATNVSERTDISESDNATSQKDMEKYTLTPFIGDDGANGKKSFHSCASERDCSREQHVQIEKSESFESEVESNKRKFPTPTLLLSSSSSSTTSLSCEKEVVESWPESRTKKFRRTEEKDQMFEVFQPWAVKTYGDESKAKTITRKKKSSILQILEGDSCNPLPCPKLRCWVQSKGFTTKRPENEQDTPLKNVAKLPPDDGPDLYVGLAEKDFFGKGYRKVAIVEEFFDIIYDAHVELGSRDGKHAGQKRTYKIITDSYIYLPRRAVTKFLTLCATCRNNPLDTPHAPVDESTLENSLDLDTSCNFHEAEDNVSTSDLNATLPDGVDALENVSIPLENVETKEKRNNETHVELVTKEEANKERDVESKVEADTPMTEIKGELDRRVHQSVADDENEVSSTQDDFKPEQSLINTSTDKSEENLSHSEVSSTLTLSTPLGSIVQDVTVVKEKFSEFAVPQCKKIKLKSTETLISDKQNDLSGFPKTNTSKVYSKSTPPKKRYNNFKTNTTIDYVALKPSTQNLQKAAMTFSAYTAGLMACDDAKSKLLKSYLNGFNTHKLEVCKSTPLRLDLRKVNPITSTYLKMTRSMGLSDEDALKFDGMETVPTSTPDVSADPNPEDAYAGLMKDADKLKLMLLAWNYQNSNAVRNGTEGPDLGVVGGLWAQYQNALALTAKQSSVSPINRADQSSPIENQDETNSSGQKDEDDASEDDSDDKLDQNAQDPERLKAFNMFVRLFVDENLDRMIPISKQPKEKIQAIIDSCARQFPEFCERSRKRIRTYLKSCRRNKKAKEGWDNSSRPTPAHLTSVQAEQILALACENESLNAKRMRIGLDPISQSLPLPSNNNAPTETMTPSITYPGFRATPTTTSGGSDTELAVPSTTSQTVAPARTSPLGLSVSTSDTKSSTALVNGTTSTQVSSPIYRPADFASPSSTSSPFQTRPQPYSTFFQNTLPTNAPTDLSMKQQQQQQQQQLLQPPTNPQLPITGTATNPPSSRPPLISHKLNPNEINAVRQLITGYRESAAFLLRSADELEQLLLQQQ